MLARLSIRDIVLIDRLDIEFASGLSVLTGETGAGKSILLDAFAVALGARGDAALVRHGAEQGQVTAAFELPPNHPVRALMDESKVNAIVDVRSPLMQASTGRIPGARTIDMQKIAESFKGVPVDGEVIVYCACPNEATAVKVAQMLRKVGYKRIRPLYGGIDAWIEAGNAVEH